MYDIIMVKLSNNVVLSVMSSFTVYNYNSK